MTHVVEVNDPDELDHYYLVWNSLLPVTRGASFFQSLDWLQTYWRHYGHGQKLRVLFVYADGAPVGVLPLCVIRETTRIGAVRVLTYPLRDWGTFFGPIGPKPSVTLLAGLRHLRETPRDWDLLDLRWVDPALDLGRTPTAMQAVGFHGAEQLWRQTAIIDAPGSWDDYLASRTSKFRNNLRRAERRAAELGTLRLERHRPRGACRGDGDPRWDLFDECVELARRSWQGSSTTGTTLSHETVLDFLRETHALAAKAGMLDVNVLRLNDRAVAFGYNYICQGRVFGLRAGYDPDPAFRPLSVGSLLMAAMLRDGIARRDESYDIGSETLPAKQPWLTRLAASRRYTHYSLFAPRVQLLRVKHWLYPNAQALAEEALLET